MSQRDQIGEQRSSFAHLLSIISTSTSVLCGRFDVAQERDRPATWGDGSIRIHDLVGVDGGQDFPFQVPDEDGGVSGGTHDEPSCQKNNRTHGGWKRCGNKFNPFWMCVPVSAIPMLRMGALCFWTKSSGAALKLRVPSSFLIILKTRMVSPFASQVINALQREDMRVIGGQHEIIILMFNL